MIAALVTMLIATFLVYGKVGKSIPDIPNERSLHTEPIPRAGGVALMAGILSAWALMIMSLAWWVVVPVIMLFMVSLLDDLRGLPVSQRLLAHSTAAAILVIGSGLLVENVALALIALIGTIWVTNLYNFMDGSDGLAGGMAFFGFTMYGVAALMHGDDTQAMLNFSIAAAALGFLYYNFSPAQIFMGDSGSIPLGFLVGAMGLWGWQQAHWPWWFPLLVFSPFAVDATTTLFKRTLRREKIQQAHCEHYYQRLIRMGWGHRNIALLEYILMFAAGASAIWALRHSVEFPWPLFAMWGGIYATLMLAVDNRWAKFQRGPRV